LQPLEGNLSLVHFPEARFLPIKTATIDGQAFIGTDLQP